MNEVFQFGGVLLPVGNDMSAGIACLTPEAMDILGVELADVDADGGRAGEGDGPGGRGTGDGGCVRGGIHWGECWCVAIVVMGVGVVILTGEGSDIGEGRGTGRTVYNGQWREGLENVGRHPMECVVEIDVGDRWHWKGGQWEEESQAVGK
jgi:hypothetical protein